VLLFSIFCVFFNDTKFESLNPVLHFIGLALMYLLVFDVGLAWPDKGLYHLVSDPQLNYQPQPYIYITLPLCILLGTLAVGVIILGAKILILNWRQSLHV
jgi:hypothetical protein